MKLFEKGIGEVVLNQNHFKASGGEGDIYVLNNRAYKLYQDPKKAIPEAKINELAGLSLPTIIKPEHILLDTKNKPVGYSMNLVPDNYALCQLFPKAFKLRNSLKNDQICQLVLKLRSGIEHVHSKGITIVDVNELNFLVDKQFKDVFFIDVDSYKTKSFPPTAIMDSVRDRHSTDFSYLTDWFSFAVIAFNLFVGIHPFRGTYQPFANIKDNEKNLDLRMLKHVSVLNKDVRVPPTVLGFDTIPKSYLDWFTAVFEQGKRLEPPKSLVETVIATVQATIKSSHKFIVESYLRYNAPVKWYQKDFVFADKLYHKNTGVNVPQNGIITFTPKLNKPIFVYLEDRLAKFYDINANQLIGQFEAEAINYSGNNVYIKNHEKVLQVTLFDANKTLVATKLLCNVLPQATKLYRGCLIQDMLGKYLVSLLDIAGQNRQIELKELAGYKIIDASYENGILIVAAVKNGQYKHLIFKVSADNKYILRTVDNNDSINFTTLDNGVCLYQNGEKLEVFSNTGTSITEIEDEFLEQSYILSHNGTQALAIVGNEIFKISMKK